jgi:di/tricarboxylate transporter
MPEDVLIATGTPKAARAKNSHEPEKFSALKAVGTVVGIIAAAAMFWMPAAQQMPALTRAVISVLALSIVFWMFSVFENHIVGFLMMGLFLLIRVPSDIVFSGFATSTFWILFASFYFGFVMEKSGLAKRIGWIVLKLFRPSYVSILFSFFLIGMVLSFFIAVGTVRVAIMIPLAWSLVKRMGLPERSAGSALLVVSACEMALVPGFATLTGTIDGMTYANLFHALGLPMSWFDYAKVAAIPATICSFIILGGNLLLLRRELPALEPSSGSVEDSAPGGFTHDQKWMLVIALSSVALWSTERIHHIDAASIALFAIVAMYSTRVLSPREIETGVSWRLVLFVGSNLSLAKVISTYGIEKMAGAAVFARVGPYLVSAALILVLVPVMVFLLRFVLITSLLTCVTVFVALHEPLARTHVPPIALAFSIMLASVPFWFLYQNFWLAMSEGITDQRAFTRKQQAKLATVYAGSVVVAIIISIAYWHIIHII